MPAEETKDKEWRGHTRRVEISWRMSITSLAACCFDGRVDMFGVEKAPEGMG